MLQKNLISIKQIVIIFISMFLIMSCNEDDPTQPQEDEIVISDSVVILEDHHGVQFSASDANNLLIPTSNETSNIVVGDILIGTANGGFLRRATSVTASTTSMEIETVQAVLTEAIENGSMDTTLSLNFGGTNRSLYGLELVQKMDGVEVVENGINISGTELYNGNFNGTDILISIPTGAITFTPELDIGFDISWFSLQEFHAIASGALGFDFDLRGEFSGSIANFNNDNDPIELASFSQTFTQMVGIVPIVEVVTLSFEAGYSVDFGYSGAVQTGFDSNISIECGAIWEDGVWDDVWNPSYDFNWHPLEWNAEAHANLRGYIRPKISIEFYSIAGPYLDVEPYLRFHAGVEANPPNWEWGLYGGMESTLGFQISVLDWELANFNTELLNPPYEFEIISQSGGFCSDNNGNVYETVNIGSKVWMAENLKATHYKNGDPIQSGFSDSEWSQLDETEEGAFAIYPVDTDLSSMFTCQENCAEIYGNLYNWYAIEDNREICPEGFHIPTDEEWSSMEEYLGIPYYYAYFFDGFRGTDEGSKLAGDNILWGMGIDIKNNEAFGTSGFNGLPGGLRDITGANLSLGYGGYFWSSTSENNESAWMRSIDAYHSGVNRNNYDKRRGVSVRCVGD